ncbi:hypothetical protein quinque_007928 [Culex quinquefasciatus]
MGINMFNRNDDRSGTAGPRSRYDYYCSTSSQSSSVENQKYVAADQTSSLFGDPVVPTSRHADLLEGGDLYQNLKNNIELYHSKLYNEQEKQRQAERDRMFNQFTSGAQQQRHQVTSSATTTSTSGSTKNPSLAGNVVNYVNDPTRRFSRTQSASIAVDLSGSRPTLPDMDMLKHNDWINFSEYEYQNSLIPKTSQTVSEVQQFVNNNLSRTIENGVFQNPRVAAMRSRRNSMSDNLYAGAGSVGTGYETLDNVKPSTFTILGHGGFGYDSSSAGGVGTTDESNETEYERMLRYSKAGATTPILKDKITTGSNFRVAEARQNKKPAFTIINEFLPKSSSFDVTTGPFMPYQAKHRLAANRILSASSVGTYGAAYGYQNRTGHTLELPSDDGSSMLHHQRRFSHSEVSLNSEGRRKKSTGKKDSPKKSGKRKTSVVNPGRKQRGVLEVVTKSPKKHARAKSAKLTVTGASDDGRSPTPSDQSDLIDIPEHHMRHMKLFSYKPFSRGPMLSPVPDKSSMENSQVDLKEESPKKGKGGALRAPVFNIRSLLSPGKSKAKEESPEPAAGASPGGKTGSLAFSLLGGLKKTEGGAVTKESEGSPKKKRFNLARAIIDYGKKTEDPPPPPEKKADSPKKVTRPEVKRDGKRKDSEGNRVKDGGKKGKGKGKVKPKKSKSGGYDDDDDYYEEQKPVKRGMLRGALNLASSFTSKGGGSKKGAAAASERTPKKLQRSGKASERAAEKSATSRGGRAALKSATGSRGGKPLRKSSSANALNVDSVKKLNRLYEKNAKAGAAATTGKAGLLKGQDKKSRQSSDSLLKKSDSRGEMKQKTGSKEKEIQKRDSEKSLKKNDSTKSILRTASKASLFGKRSDSKTSLHQTDAKGAAAMDMPPGSSGGAGSMVDMGKSPMNTLGEAQPEPVVKSTRATPNKLQSKGSLISLLSMRSSTRKPPAEPDSADGEKRGSRPGTALSRQHSASARNVAEKGTPKHSDRDMGSRTSIREKPGSTKPTRRGLSKNNSLISMKSIAHARSFTNIRPTPKDGSEALNKKNHESMPQMTKVQEGSQEHDDGDEAGGAGGGAGKSTTTATTTNVMTVAGAGEGEKVSNEYMEGGGAAGTSGMNPGNQPSANTDPMQNGEGSDEFNETGKSKCCACCAPCWHKTCLPFKRCFGRCSSCCGKKGPPPPGPGPEAKGAKQKPDAKSRKSSFWQKLNCCRSCRRSKTSPAEAHPPPAATPKKSCWQSLNCCASCRRNKSRELVPRSSIDSEPEEKTSRCRSCWSRLLCCSRFRKGGKQETQLARRRMEEEPVEMETVKCCFCFKRTRPKLKPKPKKKKPAVKSSFNCLSCCIMCCPKKGDNGSRRTSNLSKKQSIAPTIPPEDLRPKIDMSLVEHSSMMRGAIPVLPICLAYFCLFLNVVIPGSGTILSGGLCLCIGKPRFSQHDSIKGRIGSFIINCIVGVSQCFTIIFCVVGWGWAIWWGTIMLRLAKQHRKILEMEATQEEGEEQTTLSQRTGASNAPVAMVGQSNRRDVETGR